MHYVYVLQSLKDKGYYIGYTQDIKKRLESHNRGANKATKARTPFKIIYSECFEHKTNALKREIQLKKYKGGNALKKLVKL